NNIPWSRNGYKDDVTFLYSTLKIPVYDRSNNSEWTITQKMDTTIVLREKRNLDNLVPNVRGLGLRDAVYLLEQQGLYVVCNGRGVVQSQSIEPGSKAVKGYTVYLQLN
ncbi:MAG: PASTA domain-containing protein, partial [Bacteroidales bacterium]